MITVRELKKMLEDFRDDSLLEFFVSDEWIDKCCDKAEMSDATIKDMIDVMGKERLFLNSVTYRLDDPNLESGYSPMGVRAVFILGAYRSNWTNKKNEPNLQNHDRN